MQLFGKYRAEVIDVHDPEGLGRVRTRCPKVMGNVPLAWANSSLPPNVYDIPEKGDLVWIEFEEGNVDLPIWTGVISTKNYMMRFGTYSPDKLVIVRGDSIVLIDKVTSKISINTLNLFTNTDYLDVKTDSIEIQSNDVQITSSENISMYAENVINLSANHINTDNIPNSTTI